MNPKTTISISEARKRIFDIAEEVQKPNNHYTFTENGRPKVVLMSAEEFDSWRETMEVMREFPDLDKDIKEARKDYKSGEYKNWVTLEQLLAKEGFLLADKSPKKYGISSKCQTKRAKGIK
jgi:prevent-host-death family protein